MDVFQYGDILVYRSIYAPVRSNMFVLLTSREAVVFDPNENKELLEIFQEHNIKKVHVLLTHGHYDHISGLGWLKEKIDTDVFCHEETAKRLAGGMGSMIRMVPFVLAQQDKVDGGHRYADFKKNYRPYICQADKTYKKEAIIVFGKLSFLVTSTPGHSPGSSCYVLNNRMVFTGDTLLKDDAVITRFPESNDNDYREKALPFLQSLPKRLIVMPGHGDPFALYETKTIK